MFKRKTVKAAADVKTGEYIVVGGIRFYIGFTGSGGRDGKVSIGGEIGEFPNKQAVLLTLPADMKITVSK